MALGDTRRDPGGRGHRRTEEGDGKTSPSIVRGTDYEAYAGPVAVAIATACTRRGGRSAASDHAPACTALQPPNHDDPAPRVAVAVSIGDTAAGGGVHADPAAGQAAFRGYDDEEIQTTTGQPVATHGTARRLEEVARLLLLASAPALQGPLRSFRALYRHGHGRLLPGCLATSIAPKANPRVRTQEDHEFTLLRSWYPRHLHFVSAEKEYLVLC